MIEMPIISFFAIHNFEKGTKSLEKGLFRQKRDHFFEFSDQKSLKGTKCHLRDRLATTEVALLAKAISLRGTFGVSNFFKVALLAKAVSLRGTFGDIIFL